MRLRVDLTLDNAAFEESGAGWEVATILTVLAYHIRDAQTLAPGDGASLFDHNGNTVGFWRVAD